jgi:hypothetical protein
MEELNFANAAKSIDRETLESHAELLIQALARI